VAAVAGSIALTAAVAAARLGWRLAAVAAVITATLVLVAPQWAFNRARILASLDTQDPRSRPHIWQIASRIIADHPIAGTGLGTFPRAYARYTSTGPEGDPPFAHNLFVNFAVETGLAGLTALLVFLGTGAAALVRWHARARAGPARLTSGTVLGMAAALLVHQMVDGTIMGVHLTFALYALIGLGLAGAADAPAST
jgi:O-antigen ligase